MLFSRDLRQYVHRPVRDEYGEVEGLLTLEDIIDSGFYLKDEIYIKVIRTARNLSGNAL